MKKRIKTLEFIDYEGLSSLKKEDRILMEKAIEASRLTYSPYSEFPVGCAVLLDNGEIVLGANQENAAYPSGLCAERVALFQIGVNHKENSIVKMAVHSQKDLNGRPIVPCGGCLQVMVESSNRQDSPIELWLYSGTNVLKFDDVHDLLPFSFGKNDLK
mgnify:CR=1 FL=1